MDLRYERHLYFIAVSRKKGGGFATYDRWHPFGCYDQPREDRYKNIDRTTIRRPSRRGRAGAGTLDA